MEDWLHEGHDFILEGYPVEPKLAVALSQRFPRDIRAVFLVKQDIRALVEELQKNRAKSDWVLEKTKKKGTFEKIARVPSYFGTRIAREAERCGFPVHCVDTDFPAKIAAIEKRLAS